MQRQLIIEDAQTGVVPKTPPLTRQPDDSWTIMVGLGVGYRAVELDFSTINGLVTSISEIWPLLAPSEREQVRSILEIGDTDVLVNPIRTIIETIFGSTVRSKPMDGTSAVITPSELWDNIVIALPDLNDLQRSIIFGVVVYTVGKTHPNTISMSGLADLGVSKYLRQVLAERQTSMWATLEDLRRKYTADAMVYSARVEVNDDLGGEFKAEMEGRAASLSAQRKDDRDDPFMEAKRGIEQEAAADEAKARADAIKVGDLEMAKAIAEAHVQERSDRRTAKEEAVRWRAAQYSGAVAARFASALVRGMAEGRHFTYHMTTVLPVLWLDQIGQLNTRDFSLEVRQLLETLRSNITLVRAAYEMYRNHRHAPPAQPSASQFKNAAKRILQLFSGQNPFFQMVNRREFMSWFRTVDIIGRTNDVFFARCVYENAEAEAMKAITLVAQPTSARPQNMIQLRQVPEYQAVARSLRDVVSGMVDTEMISVMLKRTDLRRLNGTWAMPTTLDCEALDLLGWLMSDQITLVPESDTSWRLRFVHSVTEKMPLWASELVAERDLQTDPVMEQLTAVSDQAARQHWAGHVVQFGAQRATGTASLPVQEHSLDRYAAADTWIGLIGEPPFRRLNLHPQLDIDIPVHGGRIEVRAPMDLTLWLDLTTEVEDPYILANDIWTRSWSSVYWLMRRTMAYQWHDTTLTSKIGALFARRVAPHVLRGRFRDQAERAIRAIAGRPIDIFTDADAALIFHTAWAIAMTQIEGLQLIRPLDFDELVQPQYRALIRLAEEGQFRLGGA